MQHELMVLPYEIDALAPNLSKETLEYHYGKHHATYVKKVNGLLEQEEGMQDYSLEDIIKKADGKIFNNGAQVYNHDLYWRSLTPGTTKPSNGFKEALEKEFGSLEQFKEQFFDLAANLFGSGWVWLSVNSAGKLEMEKTSNADNPLRAGKMPLFNCDMWEHAYYIDYRNDKKNYLEKWWEIVDWDFISNRYAETMKSPESFTGKV